MMVLGLMMVRNGEDRLLESLDRMGEYCDTVFVADDRSSDRSAEIARRHPLVGNLFLANPRLSDKDWFLPEDQLLGLLYKMADLHRPDWVLRLDCDEYIDPGGLVRDLLGSAKPDTAGIRFPKVSIWEDADYPFMVPLLGSARSRQGAIWRYFPDLTADKPLHNPRMPESISRLGNIIDSDSVTFFHCGWNTLAKRLERVDFYTRMDPQGALNFGIPYDQGLLFGFSRDQLQELIAEYRRRLSVFQSAAVVPTSLSSDTP